MKRAFAIGTVFVGLAAATGIASWTFQNAQIEPLPRIAHAGGGHAGQIYTNSHQTLDANASRFDLFEIDFNWTSDGHLVCIHDWDATAQKIFGRSFSEPPTREEFTSLADPKITPCTIESLFLWLEANPGARIVTDIKDDNLKALATIAAIDPAVASVRFVPQIYHPNEYGPTIELGYKDVIWTLYTFGGNSDEVVRRVTEMELYAVTMPRHRADEGLARRLDDIDVGTYVHTINSTEEAEVFFAQGIDEIYTDWLYARDDADSGE